MDRLPSVIGPAPSELPFEEFVAKLRLERQRIVNALTEFRMGYTKKAKPKRKRKPKVDPELAKLMKKYGMTMAEVLEFAKGLKNE